MKQNIYDDPGFFAGYSKLKRSTEGLAGAPEWPIYRSMLPDLAAKRGLDLGCGFGLDLGFDFGFELGLRLCHRYRGGHRRGRRRRLCCRGSRKGHRRERCSLRAGRAG